MLHTHHHSRELSRERRTPAFSRRTQKQPLITLLTDFGNDEGAYLVRSAIRSVHETARIEDATHSIPAFNILVGAWRLGRIVTAPTEREGTIYVGIVDPGVGTSRRGIIVQTREGKYLVGPDNGLLSIAFLKEKIESAVAIENEKLTLLHLAQSRTFHGKDIFGPVAAHLAKGVKIDEFGSPLSIQDLACIQLSAPITTDSRTGSLVDIDHFGNARTTLLNHVPERIIGETARLRVQSATTIIYDGDVVIRRTFGDAKDNEFFALLASTGCIDLCVREGSGSERLGITFNQIRLTTNLVPTISVTLQFS